MRRKKIPNRIRRAVVNRAAFICEYCHIPMAYVPDPFDVEHILPVSKGGSDDLDNLANTCGGCNGYKGNSIHGIDPGDGKTVQLFHPRFQKWTDHFTWSDQFTHVIGLTPTGRATVNSLQLNRPALLNLRSLLIIFGEHPPKVE